MRSTRRDFLKTALGASALVSFGAPVPAFLRRAAADAAGPRADETVLVAIQLTGGNDGLNTVVPYEDDLYHRSRPTLALRKPRVLRIDDELGFHPSCRAFQGLVDEGLLGILQGVGYPGSSRDHGSALRDWHTARPGSSTHPTGWLGSAIDSRSAPGGDSVLGAFVGTIPTPFALHAERALVPAIRSLGSWSIAGSDLGDGWEYRDRLERLCSGGSDDPLVGFLREATRSACVASRRVDAAMAEIRSEARGYPDLELARTLRTCAAMIRAGCGTRVYVAELGGGGIGGFDSHANQAANHGALLEQLSASVAAFVRDLRRDGLHDRVLVLTFSEFGRTLLENGRRGTDHGAAAPVFLAGGRIRGGVLGARPPLDDLDEGGLRFQVDFRRVYATVLERWLGWDSEAALGGRHEPVDILRA